jgi:superfamily II helicase
MNISSSRIPVRGVHYELSLALAPPETQLLLLSGSVNNPEDVVEWLRRNGRDSVLVRHDERPVPQHEVDLRICRTSAFCRCGNSGRG